MPCEFSLQHYDEILSMMGNRAGSVAEHKDIVVTHDIDILPIYALNMARLEHDHGIKSTYYVLPHSDWYNAFSAENMLIWAEISKLGHEIALHYDGRYDTDLPAIHKAFCAIMKTSSVNVSQHLVGITPNVYLPPLLQDRTVLLKEGYKYVADSGGWWRNGCLCNHLDGRVLTICHPIWWSVSYDNPFADVLKDAMAVMARAEASWTHMVNEHRKQKTVQVKARSA